MTIMSLYAQQLVRYPELGISLDFSKLPLDDAFLSSMQGRIDKAFADMKALESGAIANPDEKRMVGHYWLRNSSPEKSGGMGSRVRRKPGTARATILRNSSWLSLRQLLVHSIQPPGSRHSRARATSSP